MARAWSSRRLRRRGPRLRPRTRAWARPTARPDKAAADICSRCGAFACSACLIISENGTGICQACWAREGGAAVPFPWEQRRELGFFNAYWQTTKKIMFQPGTAFDRMVATTGKWWDPLSYSILSWCFAVSGTLLLYTLGFGVAGLVGYFSRKPDGLSGGAVVGIVFGVLAAYAIIIPLFGMVFAIAASGLDHLTLGLVKVETRPFEATLRVFCFSQAPMFWGVVPYCGIYALPVWHLVCRIFGYKAVHKTTGGKAAAGALIPVAICCSGLGAIYAVIIIVSIASKH